MHEGGSLQSLSWRLLRHFRARQPAQFLINRRQQLLRSLQIAALDALDDLCDVADDGEIIESA